MTLGYAGSAVEALFFHEDPCEVLARRQDDRHVILNCVHILRSEDVSESVVCSCRKQAWEEAQRMARTNKAAVCTVAQVLTLRRVLSGPEVEAVVQRLVRYVYRPWR
jgi:hypothetical protein